MTATPIAGENTLIIYEDNNGQTNGAYTFVLSDEGFKGNTIRGLVMMVEIHINL